MKNRTTLYISTLLGILICLPFSAFAKDDLPDKLPPSLRDKIINKNPTTDVFSPRAFSWYCKHTKNGEIPVCPAEMSFISEYDGVFLGNTDDKVIYLTFDAGYENGNIKRILDIMNEKDVTGAFFILENVVKKNPELVMQMSKDGHLICNHTAKHRDMSAVTSESAFVAELEAMNKLCADIGVECAPFYRPPEGRFSLNNLEWAKKHGYTSVFWSFAYADWDNSTQPVPSKAKEKILEGTHNGMILLLHPTSSTNAEILSDLIDTWKADGYRFGSLTELTQN